MFLGSLFSCWVWESALFVKFAVSRQVVSAYGFFSVVFFCLLDYGCCFFPGLCCLVLFPGESEGAVVVIIILCCDFDAVFFLEFCDFLSSFSDDVSCEVFRCVQDFYCFPLFLFCLSLVFWLSCPGCFFLVVFFLSVGDLVVDCLCNYFSAFFRQVDSIFL